MIPAPRPVVGPLPGDLYLDPAVPDCERVTMTRNGWTAQVTHVWTGTGWSRLVPGLVRDVPSAGPVAVRSEQQASAERTVQAWRERKRRRDEDVDRHVAEVAALAQAAETAARLRDVDLDAELGDPLQGWGRVSAG